MSKNSKYSFSNVPSIKYKRSRFDLSGRIQCDANVGELVPFYIEEVLPGDTFKIKSTCVSRLSSTYLKPIMDNLFRDEYFFFVPARPLYDKFVNVFGENTQSAWANTKEYSVPMLDCSTENVGIQIAKRSVGDFLGLPVTPDGKYLNRNISILPFRAFAKIYDEWFRDENNCAPMHIQTGELDDTSEYPNSADWAPNNYTGMLPKVAKFHDYFTSCLPAPQKGSAVDLPVLAEVKDVPVVTSASKIPTSTYSPLQWMSTVGGIAVTGNNSLDIFNGNTVSYAGSSVSQSTSVLPSNLFAKTSTLSALPFSVNDLRFAVQLQKMLERDARSGSRYCEYLLAHFGVSSPDLQLQRCEFLGGKRSPISIAQVTQTSTPTSAADDPTGSVYGMSHSVSTSRATKGFTEHGYVIGVTCIRQFHTYTQGIPRMFTRSARTDFYDPVFASIGEQPVYKSELFGISADGDVFEEDKTVFGYQEAWAEYRQRPAKALATMRDDLRVWNLSDNYANAPTLNSQFIEETADNLDNSISVKHSAQPQFILDFYVQNIAYRNMPTYSVPGLVDHH